MRSTVGGREKCVVRAERERERTEKQALGQSESVKASEVEIEGRRSIVYVGYG
ncbi:hypothetical protein YC2023_096492 [Brassica napus]